MNTSMFQYFITRCPQASHGFAFAPAPKALCSGLLRSGLLCSGLLFLGLCLGLSAITAPTVLHAATNTDQKAPSTFEGKASSVEKESSAAVPMQDPDMPKETRELWTGKLYSSTYRAGVCLGSDGKVRGVLLLRVPSGKVDVYHFHGQYGDGRISAQHSSGHKFEGQWDSEEVISGTIRLKSGFTVDLKGQRTQGVELSETCRPLPE